MALQQLSLKEDPETKELTLLKINPKFWDSIELGITAGVDFGDILVKIIEGENIEYREEYKKIKFYWPFEGDLVSIFQNRKFKSFLDYFKDDYVTDVRFKGFKYNFINFFKSIFKPWLIR